mmetsp:Transcript_6641/g.23061  ORF Transcript_6641/g.23061 Transcript_6641/m.23061 type:complete len:334 (+) Transcript_6641:145-1146(+)
MHRIARLLPPGVLGLGRRWLHSRQIAGAAAGGYPPEAQQPQRPRLPGPQASRGGLLSSQPQPGPLWPPWGHLSAAAAVVALGGGCAANAPGPTDEEREVTPPRAHTHTQEKTSSAAQGGQRAVLPALRCRARPALLGLAFACASSGARVLIPANSLPSPRPPAGEWHAAVDMEQRWGEAANGCLVEQIVGGDRVRRGQARGDAGRGRGPRALRAGQRGGGPVSQGGRGRPRPWHSQTDRPARWLRRGGRELQRQDQLPVALARVPEETRLVGDRLRSTSPRELLRLGQGLQGAPWHSPKHLLRVRRQPPRGPPAHRPRGSAVALSLPRAGRWE